MRPPTGSASTTPGTPAPGRVLVVPGAPFATQVWGTSHDEPLQVLGNSPWGVRDSIPLTPPQTIRALDSVQRLFAAGQPVGRPGRYPCPPRHFVCGAAQRPGSRDVALGAPDPGAPRHRRVAGAAEGGAVRRAGGARHAGGLRRRQRAAAALPGGGDLPGRRRCAGDPGAPYFVDTDRLARVDGGPEVLLRLDERRRLLGQPPLGPVLMTADARSAGLPTPAGDRHRHPGGTRDRLRPGRRAFVGDPGGRRRPAHLQPGARLPGPGRRHGVRRRGPAAGSPCRARRRIPPRCPTSRRPPRPPPRSTATRRPRGCPTRCRPPSGSGCRWISTTR